jgi:hypothetical protein
MRDRLGASIAGAAFIAVSTSFPHGQTVESSSAVSIPQSTPAGPTASTIAGGVLAQAYGTRCASTVGICPIAPAPIGFYCQCGPYPGSVIP